MIITNVQEYPSRRDLDRRLLRWNFANIIAFCHSTWMTISSRLGGERKKESSWRASDWQQTYHCQYYLISDKSHPGISATQKDFGDVREGASGCRESPISTGWWLVDWLMKSLMSVRRHVDAVADPRPGGRIFRRSEINNKRIGMTFHRTLNPRGNCAVNRNMDAKIHV